MPMLRHMVTANGFGSQRPSLSFDRVESGPASTLELSQDIDLTGEGLPTVTWVYDAATDETSWSSPFEELLGFGPLDTGLLRHCARPRWSATPVPGPARKPSRSR